MRSKPISILIIEENDADYQALKYALSKSSAVRKMHSPCAELEALIKMLNEREVKRAN